MTYMMGHPQSFYIICNFTLINTIKLQLKKDVSHAEAEAIEWRLQAAKEAALSPSIIKMDCQEVDDLVNNIKGQ